MTPARRNRQCVIWWQFPCFLFRDDACVNGFVTFRCRTGFICAPTLHVWIMRERLRSRTAGRDTRILLVEDSDDVRALMMLILEGEGYHVDSAPSAEEADCELPLLPANAAAVAPPISAETMMSFFLEDFFSTTLLCGISILDTESL